MSDLENQEITELLRAWGSGEDAALGRLMPLVYSELKRMARRRRRNLDIGGSLQTTGLVHEAFLRLVNVTSVSWQERSHFYAVSAQIMRRILVDSARSRLSLKRGGEFRRADASADVDFDQIPDLNVAHAAEVLTVHDALDALARLDARQAQVVEMRFFGGLTEDEIAAALGLSAQTIKRDWRLAKAWLRREIKKQAS